MEILFHDVDGCLNTPDGAEVPRVGQNFTNDQSSAFQRLAKALDSSRIDLMAINTGRSLQDTLLLAASIDSKKLRFLVAEHGAVIFDLERQQSLDWNSTDSNPLETILAFMEWYKVDGHTVLTKRVGRDLKINEKQANLTLEIPDSIDCELVFEQLQQLVKIDSPFDDRELVFHNSIADGFIDVMSNIDKGDGIDIVCQQLGALNATTIAVGNGLNDLPMLQKADLCICPANSEPEVKDYCRQSGGIVSTHSYIDATLAWLAEHKAN